MTVGFDIGVAGDGNSDPDGMPKRYPEPAGEDTSVPDAMPKRYPEPPLDGVGEGRWLPYGGGGGRLF